MKVCSAHGCRTIVSGGSRCDRHRIVRGAQHRALREQVLAEEQTCWLCSKPGTSDDPLTLDHVVPLAHGGSHRRGNGRAAHASCNTARGTGGVGPLGDRTIRDPATFLATETLLGGVGA